MQIDERNIDGLPVQLQEMLVPGKKLRIFYNKGNINNKVVHVRAIVDDDKVVCRWWHKHQGRWVYDVLDLYKLWLMYDLGVIS